MQQQLKALAAFGSECPFVLVRTIKRKFQKLGGMLFFAASLSFCACSHPGGSTSQADRDAQVRLDDQRRAQEQADSFRLAQQREEEEKKERQQAAYRTAITYVLQHDAVIPSTYGSDYGSIPLAMRSLDISQCPADFAAAYVDHIHAWEDAAAIRKARTELESDENIKNILLEEGLQKFFGSDKDAIKDAQELETKLQAAAIETDSYIKSTFDQVEHIAATYGARLPN